MTKWSWIQSTATPSSGDDNLRAEPQVIHSHFLNASMRTYESSWSMLRGRGALPSNSLCKWVSVRNISFLAFMEQATDSQWRLWTPQGWFDISQDLQIVFTQVHGVHLLRQRGSHCNQILVIIQSCSKPRNPFSHKGEPHCSSDEVVPPEGV